VGAAKPGAREGNLERKILIIGLALTLGALALFMYERSRGPASTAEVDPSTLVPAPAPAIRGTDAPEFELPDVNGGTLKLSDLRDKVVLVNFWATWCAPCEIETPWFVEFDKKYGESGLEIVGISLDEGGVEPVKEFMAKYSIEYNIVMGNEETAQNFGGVIGLPTTFLVDQQGKFYSMHRGLVSKDIYVEEIEELLGIAKEESSESAATAGESY
jgi:cytochrome c biogenesis protein CcmG/thiol:disulfide interchange protein DsbE